jgi:hypothetical protein
MTDTGTEVYSDKHINELTPNGTMHHLHRAADSSLNNAARGVAITCAVLEIAYRFKFVPVATLTETIYAGCYEPSVNASRKFNRLVEKGLLRRIPTGNSVIRNAGVLTPSGMAYLMAHTPGDGVINRFNTSGSAIRRMQLGHDTIAQIVILNEMLDNIATGFLSETEVRRRNFKMANQRGEKLAKHQKFRKGISPMDGELILSAVPGEPVRHMAIEIELHPKAAADLRRILKSRLRAIKNKDNPLSQILYITNLPRIERQVRKMWTEIVPFIEGGKGLDSHNSLLNIRVTKTFGKYAMNT